MKWEIKKINEFTSVITGGTPSTSVKGYWENGTIPWLNSGELNQDIVINSSNYITEEGLKNSSARLMPPNTVLIALTGATTGKSALLTFEACANQSVTGILPSKYHNPKFLYYYLSFQREKIIDVSWGGAQKHINQQFIKDYPVPLPPLPIQEKIATVLDKADNLRQKYRQMLERYDQLAQSMFLEMFGEMVNNPKRIKNTNLKQFIKSIKYGTGSPPKYVDTGIPFIRATNIKEGTIIRKQMAFISIDEARKIEKCKLNEGNLIIVRSGVNAGDCARIPSEYNGSYGGYDLIIEIPEPYSTFYNYALNTKAGKALIKPLSRRAGQPHLNSDQVKELEVLYPPEPEMVYFNKMLNMIEKQKKNINIELTSSQYLFQSLLQKSFIG